jgi:hypothetical protein
MAVTLEPMRPRVLKPEVFPRGAAHDVRTPLCLIEEKNGRYTTFFTAQRTTSPCWDVYYVELTRQK